MLIQTSLFDTVSCSPDLTIILYVTKVVINSQFPVTITEWQEGQWVRRQRRGREQYILLLGGWLLGNCDYMEEYSLDSQWVTHSTPGLIWAACRQYFYSWVWGAGTHHLYWGFKSLSQNSRAERHRKPQFCCRLWLMNNTGPPTWLKLWKSHPNIMGKKSKFKLLLLYLICNSFVAFFSLYQSIVCRFFIM